MTLIEWCDTNDDTDKQGEHILDQWTGLDEQGNIVDINSITAKSGKKILWKCSKGHTWLAKPLHRTSCLSGCPVCAKVNTSSKVGKAKLKVGKNDLLTWCNNNGEYGKSLIEQFTGIQENGQTTSINSIAYGSSIKLQWICSCNKKHKWLAEVRTRTLAKSGCPYCTGNKILVGENDLYTWCIKNNRQDLIEQFTGEDAEGNKIDIQCLSYGSHKKVKWCHKDNLGIKHNWVASVKHRTLCFSDCPYCNGSKQVKPGFNDLLSWCNRNGDFGNTIIKEYTGIDIYGNVKAIDRIAPFSTSKLLWQHITKSGEMHQWYASLYNRTTHKTLCPLCNKSGTSLPEQIIYRAIKKVCPKTMNRCKICDYEFDIVIPELRTCIEYGSTYYHQGREQRDKEKEMICKENNVRFIQIIDDSSNELQETWQDNLIITRISTNKIKDIEKITRFLFKKLKLDYNKIDFPDIVEEAIEFVNS